MTKRAGVSVRWPMWSEVIAPSQGFLRALLSLLDEAPDVVDNTRERRRWASQNALPTELRAGRRGLKQAFLTLTCCGESRN